MEELEDLRSLEEHYHIHRELGRGGIGTVYLAQDRREKKEFAIRVINFENLPGVSNRKRLLNEVRAASRIRHPNIASVVDVGPTDQGCYIATRFVIGKTLRQLINEGRLTLRDAISIARQVANALAAAHEAGIVHGDIRPENILVNKFGLAIVTDFGLSHAPHDFAGVTAAGIVLPNVAYMSPELLLAKNIDQRSDLWSLGVVTYEMVSQRLPFEAGTAAATMNSILKKNPTRISARELQQVVRKSLQKSAEKRYQTAHDMASDLDHVRKVVEFGHDSTKRFSIFDRLLDRVNKGESSVRRGAEEISTEDEPTTLYINLWIEDESKTTVKLPAQLRMESSYTFFFAIEKWSREGDAITESFIEPQELKDQPVTTVVIELFCPLLVTDDESGYIRRDAQYLSGVGFKPVEFLLKPNQTGSFFLTARLLVKGETIYREVLQLEVVSNKSESFNEDAYAIATQEN